MTSRNENRQRNESLRGAGCRAVPSLTAAVGAVLLAMALSFCVPREPERGQLIWAKRAVASGSHGAAASVWADGSFIVVGHFSGQAVFGWGEPQAAWLSSAGLTDMFVASYASDGRLVWVRSAGGANGDEASAVAALDDGSAVVAGRFQERVIFGRGGQREITLVAEGSWGDQFLARYAEDGAVMWAKRIGATGDGDRIESVSIARDGSIWIAGSVGRQAGDFAAEPDEHSLTFAPDERNETRLANAGADDAVVARYAPDGRLLWAKRVGGAQADHAYAVSAMSDGSAVVTGCFGGSVTFGAGEPRQTVLSAGVQRQAMFVAHFDAHGGLLWASRAAGTASGGFACGTAALAIGDGSAVVTGSFEKAVTFGVGERTEVELASDMRTAFAASYDAAGHLTWAYDIDADGAVVFAAAPLPDGGAIVAGEDNRIGGACESCMFVSRHSRSGDVIWRRFVRGARPRSVSESATARSVAVLPDGSTLVTGDFYGRVRLGAGEPNETALETRYTNLFVAKVAP